MRPALLAGIAGLIPVVLPSGVISEWRFSEGSGISVADAVGSNPINLMLAATPNATWNSKGMTLSAGLIQTPSITAARTVAVLYRSGRGESPGFMVSGGPSGSGGGMLQDSVSPTFGFYVSSSGLQMSPLLFATAGGSAQQLNRGGWVLALMEFSSASTTALGFGGRHTATTSRCPNFDIAWSCVFNKVLSSTERNTVYSYARQIAVPRGIYINFADCPSQAPLMMLGGQSNASGRADISQMTAPESARTFTKVKIASATGSVRPTIPAALLVVGANQTAETPAGQFGLETPLAWSWEDNRTNTLTIVKTTQGSTYLAPSSLGVPVTSTGTWNPSELVNASLAAKSIQDFCDVVQAASMSGVGLSFTAWVWMQGEQDATATAYGSIYQTQLQALYDFIKLELGTPSKVIICRIRGLDPAGNATAQAQVRAAEAAFVSANSGAVLIDTDTYQLAADLVHYNAVGQRLLGAAVYAQLPA